MKKPFVIAIAGCSGSGKSTLSQMLLDDLKTIGWSFWRQTAIFKIRCRK